MIRTIASAKQVAEVPVPDHVVTRVMVKVTLGPGDCVSSQYKGTPNGGPQVHWSFEGEHYMMYHWRMYFWATEGYMPDLYTHRRTCENPKCVNPDHRKEN